MDEASGGRDTARAVELGWALGRLFRVGRLRAGRGDLPATLPTADQLDARDAAERLVDIAASCVAALAGAERLPDVEAGLSAVRTALTRCGSGPRSGTPTSVPAAVEAVHLTLQRRLACTGPTLEAAYDLGVRLAGLTTEVGAVGSERRGAWCDRLLATHDAVRDLTSILPAHAAQPVRESMARWHAYLSRPTGRTRRVDADEATVAAVLDRQLAQWIALLTGAKCPLDCLTAGGYVDAGIGTLRGIRRQAGRAAWAMWPVLLVLGGAAAAVLVVTLLEAHGSAKATTVLATAVATLSGAWKAVRAPSESAFTRYASRLGDAETDLAIAGTITVLPSGTAVRRVQRAARRRVAAPARPAAPPGAACAAVTRPPRVPAARRRVSSAIAERA